MRKLVGVVLGGALVAGTGWALILPAEPAAAPAADLSSLAWMAGSWQGTADGLEMEELWLAPKGGAMLGLHRDVAGGRMVSFEFLRIEADGEGLVYLASPKGRPPTPFRLVEASPGRAVFANPQHDFPQRVLYWLTADGALHARIEGPRGGQTVGEEWAWTRVK